MTLLFLQNINRNFHHIYLVYIVCNIYHAIKLLHLEHLWQHPEYCFKKPIHTCLKSKYKFCVKFTWVKWEDLQDLKKPKILMEFYVFSFFFLNFSKFVYCICKIIICSVCSCSRVIQCYIFTAANIFYIKSHNLVKKKVTKL